MRKVLSRIIKQKCAIRCLICYARSTYTDIRWSQLMQELLILVDYDNVDKSLKSAGPVNLAKILVTLIPTEVLSRHQKILVRMYGGWRCKNVLTTLAQGLVPDLRKNSPCNVTVNHAGNVINLRLTVDLADKPIDATLPFEESLVKDRELRKFRTLTPPWADCIASHSCGLPITSISHSTPCNQNGCLNKLGNVLVRDEQKMVDTLLVADIAYQAFAKRATDIVIVSSDTDMWPGVLLALRNGCAIIHVHTKTGWKTQRHLINTLDRKSVHKYKQMSI